MRTRTAVIFLVSTAFVITLFSCTLACLSSPKKWAVAVSLPRGPVIHLPASWLIRSATSNWGRRLLDNTKWQTRAGSLTIENKGQALVVHCAPCTLKLPKFSALPVSFSSLSMTLQRDHSRLFGNISAKNNGSAQRIPFQGNLSDMEIDLSWSLPRGEISQVFGLFPAAIPEIGQTIIKGYVSATGTLRLPEKKWTIEPHLEGFEVYGLGTERLRYGTFNFICRDQNGIPQIHKSGEGQPDWLSLSKMGRWLPRAVLAAEDSRFYQHAGYDMEELGPLLANSDRSQPRGASTLTQQLAKNFFVGAEHTAARKLRELLYTVEMERTLGKRRILTLYLNTVDWGPGICGTNDASQAYFALPPSKLDPVAAAWLGGILRNPHRAYVQEFQLLKPNRKRLNWVLGQMKRPKSSRSASHWLNSAAEHFPHAQLIN